LDEKGDLGKRGKGFLALGHNKLRFTELGETFFGRVILAKCPDPNSAAAVTVELSLRDLFRRHSAEELVTALKGVSFSEAPKFMEVTADVLGAIVGTELKAQKTSQPALDYYQNHISTRLEWLKSGDETDNRLPCIDAFTTRMAGRLVIFEITLRPAILRDRLGEHIPAELELSGKLIQSILSAKQRPVDPGLRIDYQKQVELLTRFLDERQALTGETTFSLLSSQIPFRWAVQFLGDANLTMPGIGTSSVEDKILLPLFLEVNGFLDINDLDVESDPLKPQDVVVRYSIRRPATRNIFGADNAGLLTSTRSQLNETELALYHRLHRRVREGLVFGGKPNLEVSFGTLCAWLIRKASYCLEEVSFLARPARDWLKQHEADRTLQMEDEFFLPAVYERLS
jgi:hypothetical protein